MTTFDNDSLGKLGKISGEFCCKKCDYTTCVKYNFKLHLKSIKHKNNETTTNNNELLGKISKKYECENCEKYFNDRAGLWRHKKKCIKIDEEQTEENGYYEGINIKDKDALVLHLLKQNGMLQKSLIEMSKDKSITNTNTNCNNTFNLNFFLDLLSIS